MTRGLLAVLVVALAVVAPAAASEQNPTLPELERELICPTCHETLAASTSPIAERMRAFIRARIAAGDTTSEIKAKLVDQFGEGFGGHAPICAGRVGHASGYRRVGDRPQYRVLSSISHCGEASTSAASSRLSWPVRISAPTTIRIRPRAILTPLPPRASRSRQRIRA